MSSQPNHGVLDGLTCLQALALAGEPVGCRELARRLDLHPVRVNRLLMSLAAGGFASQDAKRRYQPGPAFHLLAAAALSGSSLLRRALPHLAALARDSGAVVALGVLWRDQVCYLWHGHAAVGSDGLGGGRLHLAESSSIGQVLLAADGGAALAPERRAALAGELATVAARGHACLQHGTAERPHLSVAVAVGSPAVAGLACTSVPPDTDLDQLVSRLHDTARRIAEEPTP